MIASKLARSTLSNIFNSSNSNVKVYTLFQRNIGSQAKSGFFRRAIRSRIETGASSASESISTTPISIGRGFVAGASVIGLGSLAFYGLGLSNQSGILDRSATWPQFIRERIHSTYTYFGAGLGVTAASAYGVTRSPALMNLVARNSIWAVLASFACVIGSGMLVRSIPYEKGTFGSKQLAWALHASLLGAFVAPLAMLGGPLLMRAAWYTAGVIGGLSTIAVTAPSEKFLNMGGPLAIGLGLVFAASVGGMFFPPTHKLGLSLYSLSIYGGLVLFSMLLLYDTQRIVKKAEMSMHFDPVNESIAIYLDTLNIFIRIATILATGGNRRK